MLKRLLPLLLLLSSPVLYGAETSTISPDDEPKSISKEDRPDNSESSWDETSSSPDDTSSNQSQATDTESTDKPETTGDAKADSDSKTDNDSDVDEEAIAKLLGESSDSDSEAKKEEAKKKKEESPWKPEIEFGYQSRKGNDDNQSLNARVALSYIKGKMRNSGEVKIYREDDDGEEEEREQSYELQSDYKLGSKTYLYGSFKGIDSKYSSYYRDYTVSTGFGLQVSNTETFKLEVELGPGYRIQQPNTDEIDDDDPIFPEDVAESIIRGNLTSSWKPFKTLSFEMQATLVAGQSNTRLDTEISALNNITDDIALKLSHNRQHISKVPNDLKNTDSTFNINLLFRF